MHRVDLPALGTFDVWRNAARSLALSGVPAEQIDWSFGNCDAGLFDGLANNKLHTAAIGSAGAPGHARLTAPKAFLDLAEQVICHSAHERFSLLYSLLLRLQNERGLLADRADPLVNRIQGLAKNIRRDCHKMTAFVRFREVAPIEPGRRAFYSWFEPDHYIVERTSSFFAKRFADMDWTIATPKGCSHFRGGKVSFSEAVDHGSLPPDETDELWRTYYANIFNPARLKVKAMQAEMPKKYWKNMPETQLIPGLIAGAEQRVREMREKQASQPPVRAQKVTERFRAELAKGAPQATSGKLDAVRAQASACTRCPLYCQATQTVFGAGPEDAEIMFVGEQPGDREDLAGEAFVGPAGQLFNAALDAVGFDCRRAYVTNAVKHFKFTPRGKRRIHATPNAGEVDACRFWLSQEIAIVRPKLIVALGATAARATTERGDRILARRGTLEATAVGTPVFLTVHPSSILRTRGDRTAEERAFQDDLRKAVKLLAVAA
ncbi:MAG: UdgX family uracil-DNA binding protein [Pseudomonadota bacterium]